MLNTTRNKTGEKHMNLGAFSVSLSVKDIAASQAFYEKLGFEPIGGNAEENWLILRNGDHVIGLFQGMFERNILTFNPGWDQQSNETATIHGCSRNPAHTARARSGTGERSRRGYRRARKLYARRP